MCPWVLYVLQALWVLKELQMVCDTVRSTGAGGHTCWLVPEAGDRHVGPSSGAGESPPWLLPAQPAPRGRAPWPSSPLLVLAVCF